MLNPSVLNHNQANETRSRHSSPSSVYSDTSNPLNLSSTCISFEKSPSLEDYLTQVLNQTRNRQQTQQIKPIQATLINESGHQSKPSIHPQIGQSSSSSNQHENSHSNTSSSSSKTTLHPSKFLHLTCKMKSHQPNSKSNPTITNISTCTHRAHNQTIISSPKSPPSPSHSISPPSSAGLIEHHVNQQDPTYLRTDQYNTSLSSGSSHSDDQELVSLYSKYQSNHSSSIHSNHQNQPFEDISSTNHTKSLDLPSSISSNTSTSSIYSNEINSTEVLNELNEMLGEAIDSVHDTFNSSSDHQTLVEELESKDKVNQSESYSSLLTTINKSIAAKQAQNVLNKQQVLSMDRTSSRSSSSSSNYSPDKLSLIDKEQQQEEEGEEVGDEIADRLTPLPVNLSPSNSAETNINESTLTTTTNNPPSITTQEQTSEIIPRPSPSPPTHPLSRSPPPTTNLQSPGAPKPISTYPQLISRHKPHTTTKVSSPLTYPSIILQSSPDKSSHNIHEQPSPRSNLPNASRTTSSPIGRSSSELSNLHNWQWLDSNTGTPKPNQLVNNFNELTKNERILKHLNDYYKSSHNENELTFKTSLLNQTQMKTKSLKNKNLNINFKEFKKIKSTADRCKIYSSKINEMWQVKTGLDVWLFYRTNNEEINLDNDNKRPIISKLSYQSQPSPPSPIPQYILNEGNHSRDTSSSSILSFPARSDATRAIEITETSGLVEIVNTSNTSLPNPLMAVQGLPYPGLYQPNGGSGSTNSPRHNNDVPDYSNYSFTVNNTNNNSGTLRNLVTNNHSHNKPSTLSFLSQLKRKNSNRKHNNLPNLNNNNNNISSKQIKSKISSPILSNHHHHHQRKPNGARKPNPSISNNLISTSTPPHEIIKNNQNKAIFKDNKFNRSSLGFNNTSNNTSNNNNDNFDNLKINKILDILPFANKKRLEEILVRENGDDVATISAYLEEERKNG